jgi:hypothetical protein
MAPKPPSPFAQRPVAAHVQTAQNAVRQAVQPRLHPAARNQAPLPSHVSAARPVPPRPQPVRPPAVQPRLPSPPVPPRQPAAHVRAAVHASAPGAVLARAQNPATTRAPHVQAATRPVVLQPVMASRVQRADNPKVIVVDKKVSRYESDPDFNAGINVSFKSDEHAQGFLDNKGDDRIHYEIVTWDFDDELYEMIQYQITRKNWDKKWTNKPKWKDVEGCPRPVPTSDHWVTDKNNAPHLKDDKWITVLNSHAKGGAAAVYRPGEDLALLKDSDVVVILEESGNFAMSLKDAKATYTEDEYVTEWTAKFRGLVYE